MKQALKLFGGFILGIIGGFTIATLGVLIFTDISASKFLNKFFSTEISELAIVTLSNIAFLIFAFFFHVITHELGHLICGLASGYKFVSFRILKYTIIKENNKLRIKKFGIAGTGGQCLLTAPDRPISEISVMWYNIGGVLANLLFSTITLLAMIFIDMPAIIFAGLAIFIIVGYLFALINGIPLKISGVSNDGMNILQLNKNINSKWAFITQLRVNALAQQGTRIKDMPAQWFEPISKLNPKDAIQAAVMIMTASIPLDNKDWKKAIQMHEELYQNSKDIIKLLNIEVKCELVFLYLMVGENQKARELYDDELKKYIAVYKKLMSSKMRLLCATTLIIDNDRTKAEEILNQLISNRNKFLMQGEVEMDIDLAQTALSTTPQKATEPIPGSFL
ncbi:MAG: hypothetical protein PHR45_07810 [Muribaculaceae bacterium]|nr:hypothetical protein [Muribaculaceae bacterium]